jgi:hypothetical protein
VPPDAIELEQRLADHPDLGPEEEAALDGGPGGFDEHPADVEVLEVRLLKAAYEVVHAPGERGPVDLAVGFDEAQQRVGRLVAASLGHGQHQRHQAVLHVRREPRDHAQVEQGQAAVFRDEHVPRVRVGVDESIDEDLLQIGAQQLVGEPRAVDRGAIPRGSALILKPWTYSIVRTREVVRSSTGAGTRMRSNSWRFSPSVRRCWASWR